MAQKERHIYLIGFCCFVLAAIFSLGYHHFDEHFQILEFAGLKLNLIEAKDLPWEFHEQMRPSIQPALVVVLYRFIAFFGEPNPFFVAMVLRLFSGFLAFLSLFLLYKTFRNKIENKTLAKWFLWLSFLLWFAIYNGVRFSSENWSGSFFIIAFALFFSSNKTTFKTYLGIGLLLGFSFLFRYQAAFLIAGFGAWLFFIKKEKFANLIYLLSGIGFVVLLGILIDRWFYEEWTFSAWNYFEQNILADKVSSFGTSLWWHYFKRTFEQGIPPFSLLYILGLLSFLILKPKSPISWSIIPFLLIHFLIGHKELRFLFPIIPFMPLIIVQSLEAISKKYNIEFYKTKAFQVFMKTFFVVNFIFLAIIIFRPADNQIALYQTIYKQYEKPTILYYLDENPYLRVLNIHFYKRKNLEIKQISSLQEIKKPKDKNQLIVFTQKNVPKKFKEKNNPIYTSFPNWIKHFNFNNWLSRVNSWWLFEIE